MDLPSTAQAWGSLGIWMLVFLAVYCAVAETVNAITYHGLRADLDEWSEYFDQRIDGQDRRLELIDTPDVDEDLAWEPTTQPIVLPAPEGPVTQPAAEVAARQVRVLMDDDEWRARFNFRPVSEDVA